MKNIALLISFLFLVQLSFADNLGIYFPPGDSSEEAPDNWFNKDQSQDQVRGISTEKAYQTILKGKKSETVIVAILDSGVDIEHEDLKDIIWVNEDEIAGNGIDDDGNGYIDDVHGWNFIGGKNGENVSHDTYELTRLYREYKNRFEGKLKTDLKGKDKKAFDVYKSLQTDYNQKKGEMQQQGMIFQRVSESFKNGKEALKDYLGDKPITTENLESISPTESKGKAAKEELLYYLGFGLTEDQIEEANEYFSTNLDYYLNTEFDSRSIVGDNYADVTEQYYGNNDVKGPDSKHGTHVAGIVAAIRNNNIGMNGVADNVRIMSVRTVPDGDERDKDVANAIRYAVDNGARVINMSFGKSYSPNKSAVDKAVKYAQKKGVLLIHAAGNDSKDIDVADNFPTRSLKKSHSPKVAKNWLEIGASTWKSGENFVADFSNYGKTSVDLFAPGFDIYSTTPENTYSSLPGTSMAAPMVAGVAALVMSYYPDLDYKEVKGIIMDSAVRYTNQNVAKPVENPEESATVSFGTLSVTGGLLNAYEAVKLADERSK